MFYREVGEFRTTYAQDNQTFPIRVERFGYYALLAVVIVAVPLLINDYWANAVLVPFLIWSLAALGLNILTGYCGQLSLGTGGFMAVGAYGCYKLMTAFPDLNIVFCILLAGLITSAVGIFLGSPRCGSRDSISPWRRSRRNSFLFGSSTGCLGSTTTRLPDKSMRPRARYSASKSPDPR